MPKSGTEQYVESGVATDADFEKRLNNLETAEPSVIDPPDRGSYVNRHIGSITNATNNWATITYDAFLYGADIDISTGVFTAPVDGRYLFLANIHYTTTGSAKFRILLDSATEVVLKISATRLLSDMAIVLSLTAGQTVEVQFANNGSGTVTVLGTFGNTYKNSFQSELLVASNA